MAGINVHASRLAQRTIRRNPKATIEEFFRDLKTILQLSMKSRKMIQEINELAKLISETEREKAETIYRIHMEIRRDEELERRERELLANVFDNYVKGLDEHYPEHSSEEIAKFREFLKVYKEHRKEDWARLALTNAGKRMYAPEHIDTLQNIARNVEKLPEEHKIRVWSGLSRMANRTRPEEFHENLRAISIALERFHRTGNEGIIRMIHNNPSKVYRHFPEKG